jgi:spermidine synthase
MGFSMIPWELIDKAAVPDGGGELRLYKHGRDFSIRVDGYELMNSRVHGSEEVLAEMACEIVAGRPNPRILIGGLGMGFTASAALKRMAAESELVVAEIVPAVVAWNRGHLADLAGRPLEDPRIVVQEADIARILQDEKQAYDAILLDVDNGPDGLTRQDNNWLYSSAGLQAAYETLRPAGVLAVWSAGPDQAFTQCLKKAGFKVTENRVRARAGNKGSHHTIWLGVRGR